MVAKVGEKSEDRSTEGTKLFLCPPPLNWFHVNYFFTIYHENFKMYTQLEVVNSHVLITQLQ